MDSGRPMYTEVLEPEKTRQGIPRNSAEGRGGVSSHLSLRSCRTSLLKKRRRVSLGDSKVSRRNFL